MDFNHLFTLLFGGTFGLIGLVFLCVGIGFVNKRRKRAMTCTGVADGTVSAASPRAFFSYPVGELTYEKPCPGSSGTRAYAVGERLAVYYDPSNPSDCYIEGEFKPENLLIGIFTGIGLLFLAVALVTAIILL